MQHEQLGATYSYRRRYFVETLQLPTHIQALEIIVDHFLPLTKSRREEICTLRDRFTLLPHSLDLSLGSADGISRLRLRAIREVVRLMQAPLWSDHLAFTQIAGRRIGHLAPLPFTFEALEIVARNIAVAQDTVGVQMLVENISAPFNFGIGELAETTFLNAVCSNANVGLLLDLANLQSAAIAPQVFLAEIDPTYIQVLHVAGGGREHGIYVDAHDRPVSEEIWSLAEFACRKFSPIALVVERDNFLPPFADLRLEIDRAQTICKDIAACR